MLKSILTKLMSYTFKPFPIFRPLVGPTVFQGRSLTYQTVTGESPGEDEESPPADEICLQKALTKEAFFVDFLRTDQYDEDGVRRHPSIVLIN